jgi:AraC family transcriptional activator of pobA
LESCFKSCFVRKSKEPILQFDLSAEARSGISVKYMREDVARHEHDIFIPHRDKHYLLAVVTGGHFKMIIDFKEIEISAPAILLIFPGQVHQVVAFDQPAAVSITFDPSLVVTDMKLVLEHNFDANVYANGGDVFYKQLLTLGGLLHETQAGPDREYAGYTGQAILQSILGILAGIKTETEAVTEKDNRAAVIAGEFRELLNQHYKLWKRPADYAALLSISVSHLNDVIKQTSGETVSSQIQQRNILEAKRLLYFSNLTVRQISFELGYDDNIYFSKMFKKATNMTPVNFRRQYRD